MIIAYQAKLAQGCDIIYSTYGIVSKKSVWAGFATKGCLVDI